MRPPTTALCTLSHILLFATPRTVDRQASLSMESSRKEYWSGLPFPTSGNLPNPGVEPASSVSPVQVNSLAMSHLGSPPL